MYGYGGEKIVYWQIIKRGLGAFFRCPRKRFVTSRWKSVKIYGKINTQCWGLMFAQLTLLSYKGKSCPKQEWRKRERACECVRVCAIKDRESACTWVSEERGEKDQIDNAKIKQNRGRDVQEKVKERGSERKGESVWEMRRDHPNFGFYWALNHNDWQ